MFVTVRRVLGTLSILAAMYLALDFFFRIKPAETSGVAYAYSHDSDAWLFWTIIILGMWWIGSVIQGACFIVGRPQRVFDLLLLGLFSFGLTLFCKSYGYTLSDIRGLIDTGFRPSSFGVVFFAVPIFHVIDLLLPPYVNLARNPPDPQSA